MSLSNDILKRIDEEEVLSNTSGKTFTNDGFDVYVSADSKDTAPHFHYKANGTSEFDTCIKIDEAEYLYQNQNQSILNRRRLQRLVEFLNGQDDNSEKTRWQELLMEWNKNNSTSKVDTDLKMPDYNNLHTDDELE